MDVVDQLPHFVSVNEPADVELVALPVGFVAPVEHFVVPVIYKEKKRQINFSKFLFRKFNVLSL